MTQAVKAAQDLELLIDRVEGRSHLLANLLRIAVRVNNSAQYSLGRQDKEDEVRATNRRQSSYDALELRRRRGEEKEKKE